MGRFGKIMNEEAGLEGWGEHAREGGSREVKMMKGRFRLDE